MQPNQTKKKFVKNKQKNEELISIPSYHMSTSILDFWVWMFKNQSKYDSIEETVDFDFDLGNLLLDPMNNSYVSNFLIDQVKTFPEN